MRNSILFCQHCGTAVEQRVPLDDNRARAVCPSCDVVHCVNPINVVGTIPVWGDQVLLCRRNIEPRKGFWTLPAGFMEMGETTAQGAARETDEEAGANIELQGLFSVIDVVPAGQVHFFYRARLLDLNFNPGPETQELGLFKEADVPWGEVAFHTVRKTLEYYFADAKRGVFDVHCGAIP